MADQNIVVQCCDGDFRASRSVLAECPYFAAAVAMADSTVTANSTAGAATGDAAAGRTTASIIKFDDVLATMCMIYRFLKYRYMPTSAEFAIIANYYGLLPPDETAAMLEAVAGEAAAAATAAAVPAAPPGDSPYKGEYVGDYYSRGRRKWNPVANSTAVVPATLAAYIRGFSANTLTYDTYIFTKNCDVKLHFPAGLSMVMFCNFDLMYGGKLVDAYASDIDPSRYIARGIDRMKTADVLQIRGVDGDAWMVVGFST